MTSLEPVGHRGRIADVVFDRLREGILSGEIGAGQRLSVPALAERFQVSRSPVREAVQRLTAERLAIEEPRRGCFVIEVHEEQLKQTYDVREVLEGLAARKAAEQGDASLSKRLRAHMLEHQEVVERGDLRAHVELDLTFHKLLRDAADNPLLNEMLHGINGVVQIAVRRSTEAHRRPGAMAVEEHGLVVDAIESGDGAAAELTMRAHVARMREHWLTTFWSRSGRPDQSNRGVEAAGLGEAAEIG